MPCLGVVPAGIFTGSREHGRGVPTWQAWRALPALFAYAGTGVVVAQVHLYAQSVQVGPGQGGDRRLHGYPLSLPGLARLPSARMRVPAGGHLNGSCLDPLNFNHKRLRILYRAYKHTVQRTSPMSSRI